MNVLVTGGAGFIGSALVRLLIRETDMRVTCVDALTYAGNLDSLRSVEEHPRFHLEVVDICDAPEVTRVFEERSPNLIVHLAAESHVDRSIDGPAAFVQSNVVGTQVLLEAATQYWSKLPAAKRSRFRFHHVSTDEVFGDLGDSPRRFTETTSYAPSSPYAATKAASDHLARAWHRTFHLPVIITNSSNNYGPFQFPEKLIPLMVLRALSGESLPVYGDGTQVRDWLYVDDHARALLRAATEGQVGETYLIGGSEEHANLDVVCQLCSILDELVPGRRPDGVSRYEELITFVTDRPGHDRRYAVDSSRISRELRWSPAETFESGLRATVSWYLDNKWWWNRVLTGEYRLERLGKVGRR